MGAHSNYATVEGDFAMVVFIITIAIVTALVVVLFKFLTAVIKNHYYKQFKAQQHIRNKRQQEIVNASRAYQRTLNNFYRNRIEEDMDETVSQTLNLNDSSPNLVDAYRA